MITLRPSDARGQADHGWLVARHTFSFGGYFDPAHMGFRALRVMNEDRVAAGKGFPTHPHRDMEIVTYMVEGRLAHKDSTGGQSEISPGRVQRMTAGTGIRHSEFNPSSTEAAHLLQMWVEPEREGLSPGYDERTFDEAGRAGRFRTLVAKGGAGGGMDIHQDVKLMDARLSAGKSVEYELAPGRHAWVQVIEGSLTLNGVGMSEGDGAAVSDERRLRLEAAKDSLVLLWDLA